MTYYAVGKRDGTDLLVLSSGPDVLAFESKHEAEDFIDNLDEDGEWIAVPIDEHNGEHFVVVI
jgi:hypothetical protein